MAQNDSELRIKLKNYKLINETPVGTKMFPEDVEIKLGNLLHEKDFDNLMQLVTAYKDKAVEEAIALIHGRHGIDCDKCYDDLLKGVKPDDQL